MAYNVINVANKIIELSLKENKLLAQISIIKIVYLIHGFHLALYNKNLIQEFFVAWKYGPVCKELYDKIKIFENNKIDKIINGYKKIEFSEESNKLIEDIYNYYKNTPPFKLAEITHKPGGAWFKTNTYSLIDNENIRKEFLQYISR